MNARSGPSSWTRRLGDKLAAPLPGGEDGERDDADQQGKPGSVQQLGQVGGEEEQVDGDQDAAERQHDPERPAPLMTGVVEEQQGRDGDRAGHGGAVGVGQRGRAPEREHERKHRHQQQPVDERDVDLADHLFRGVFDAQPRQVAESGGLVGDREGAGDDGLGGDDRGHGGEEDHREPGPARSQQEERAAGVALVAQDEGALAHVVQDAGGEDDQQPGPPDRRAAEVPHVRVYRFGSGDGQDDGGQREERGLEMADQEADGIGRGQCLQDLGVIGDATHAEHAEHGEPDGHDRSEQPPHRARAQPLRQEQGDDDRHRDRDDQAGD